MKRALVGCVTIASSLAVSSVAHADDAGTAPGVATAAAPTEATVTAESSTAPAEDPKPKTREAPTEIRVIGSRGDSLQRVPGSGTVVGEREMQRAVPFDTGEILRRVPGVQVRQDYGGGNRLDISIRGVESGRGRKVLLLEDGVPMSLNPYAESDMNFAPPVERYRSIEVVKGSGSILFGPQTLAGVVNFLTLNPPPGTRVTVDGEGGQRGYARGLLNFGESKDQVRYVFQAFHKRGDGVRDIEFNVTDAFGKIAFDTSKSGELVLKLGFHDEITDSDAVGLTRAMYLADPRRTSLAINDRMRVDNYQVSAIHEQRFSADTKLKTLAYAYKTDRIWRRQDYARSPTPGESYERIVGDTAFPNGAIYFKNSNSILDRSYDVVGLEPRLEHRFQTLGVQHTLDTGARMLVERAHYQQRSGGTPQSYSGSLDYEEVHGTFALAAYLQDRMAFRKNLLVTPGIRFERAAFDRTILRQQTSKGAQDTYAPGSSLSTGIIPGIGMTYGSRDAHVFGGLHVGWAPPRVTSSVSPRGTPSQTDPEESINYELGTRLNVGKWVHFEGAGFLSNFRNQVVVNTAATSSGSGGELVNGGPTRIVGAETSSLFAFGRRLALPIALDLGARYTFSRATFVGGPNDGRLLPYAPLHSFTANVDVEHEGTGLGGQVAYTFTSAQYADTANTVAWDTTGRAGILGARNIVDMTAHYNHKKTGLSFRLSVKNAFDDIYVVARRPEGIFPAGYRQIVLGVRWTYEVAPPANL